MHGIEEKEPLHRNLGRVVSLLSGSSRELPRLWTRYPPRYMQDMVEDMVALISMKEERCAHPSSILALVDPELGWLDEWFYPLHSRNCLLAKLRRQCSYLTSVLHNLLNTLQTTEFINWKHQPSAPLFSTHTIGLAQFIFNTKLIGKLVSYKEGRGLVPQLPALITALVNLVFVNSDLPGQLGADCLRRILATTVPQHAEHVDLLLDRVLQGGKQPSLVARALQCIPLHCIDSRHQYYSELQKNCFVFLFQYRLILCIK